MMVQTSLREILPEDCILVGQSLNSDLNALKMMHPYVIDTSVIFNITGDRSLLTHLIDILSCEIFFFLWGGGIICCYFIFVFLCFFLIT